MKKIISKLITVSFVTTQAFALDTYIVKHNDTLSQIVKQNYPNDHLYGANGKLSEVLKNNPHIKNAHRIYPNQKIHLESQKDSRSNLVLADADIKDEIINENRNDFVKVPKRKFSSALGIDEWNISVLYGAKYLSISQSESLGKAEVGALFINNIKVNSEFLFENWSLGFQAETYKFKYESLTRGDSKQMSSFNLYGSYQWLMTGINIEEMPLFRNNGGNIEMTKNSLVYLSLGAKKDIELSTRKPTTIKLKGWVSYPISNSSDKAGVDLSSVSGFSVNGQAELNREIFAKSEYALHTIWQAGVGYRSLEQNVGWGVSKGEVKSQILDLSTAFGVLFKF